MPVLIENQPVQAPVTFGVTGTSPHTAKRRLRQCTKPDNHDLVLHSALDLTRSKPELLLENMLLRQQLIVLKRQVKRSAFTWRDRTLFVLLASGLPHWKEALVLVQPDTVLRWHCELFRWVWRRKSRRKHKPGRLPLTDDIVALIKPMARDNRTWGAERIQGELLKLGVKAAKSTIQEYIYAVRKPRSPKQKWATFLRNHATEMWACDFLQTYDLLLRLLFVFAIIELGSRRIVHFAVTRNPSDAWLAQQLCEATTFAQGPRYLIPDNDIEYGKTAYQSEKKQPVVPLPGCLPGIGNTLDNVHKCDTLFLVHRAQPPFCLATEGIVHDGPRL